MVFNVLKNLAFDLIFNIKLNLFVGLGPFFLVFKIMI